MNARILVACANGAGTSLMMKMTAERVTKKLGMGVADIHHCALSEGVSVARQYDIVLSPLNFVNMYDAAANAGVTVIGLRNVLSDAEMEQHLVETGAAEKFRSSFRKLHLFKKPLQSVIIAGGGSRCQELPRRRREARAHSPLRARR